MTPNLGLLRRSSSSRYSISYNDSIVFVGKANGADEMASPLLNDSEANYYSKEDIGRISREQSVYSAAKTSFAGELPVGHGCSFTQTVFNGNNENNT